MAGMSYFAVVQYLAAAARPAHLAAIFPYLGWTDFYRHAVYHGGAPQSEFFSYYYSLVGATQRLRLRPGARHALGYLLDHGWFQWLGIRAFLPLRARLSAHLRPQESWTRDLVSLMFDHLTDGPFYRDKSPWPVLDRIEIPVCIGTNWGNPGLHMRGAFDAWRAVRGPKWLFIGPPDAHWPWENYQDELLAWYDWQLKGIDTGHERLPPVRYWLQGAGQWRSAADWPPPEAEPDPDRQPVPPRPPAARGDRLPARPAAGNRAGKLRLLPLPRAPYPSRNTISHGGTAVSQLTVWRLPGDSADDTPRS